MASASQSNSSSSSYWTTYLAESEPCQFPRLGAAVSGPKRHMSIRVPLEQQQKLQQLASSSSSSPLLPSSLNQAALPSLLRAAWGLLLRCYTGQDDVCFGYQELETAVSSPSLSNSQSSSPCMPVARFVLDESMSLAKILDQSKNDYVSALPYWDLSPPQSHRQLFDTAVVLRDLSNTAVGVVNNNNNTTTSNSSAVIQRRPLNTLPEEVCYPTASLFLLAFHFASTNAHAGLVQDTSAGKMPRKQHHCLPRMVDVPYAHDTGQSDC
jgi:hypothetical protein